MTEHLDIDGSRGEGGGQILRTSLALSMLTGKSFAMRNIRANRAKPGLRRQHATAVDAAARLCDATVHGAKVDSRYIEFTPGTITGGDFLVDIGSAGSTTLVVQTLLVPAIASGKPLRATIRGGTHNPMAPPFEFLERVYLPQLRAMGADVSITLDQHGFVDSAGPLGQLTLDVRAGGALRPIELVNAGELVECRATAVLSRLPTHIGDRELAVVRERIAEPLSCTLSEVRGGGTANVLFIEIERTSSFELVTGFGERGLRAETVAERACDEAAAFLAANVPVGEHLADQLLLPLAVAGGGRFRCAPLSLHATTNIETIGLFLDLPIRVEPDGDAVLVTVG
ncbi:MAG: RNA 3'-terminal phosphate cyclase [Deltaproteobacteria bacterium]|nr:RNA 3'-terminal phosphate cyclase [Deltaproteobacteria bacterium]